MEATRQGARAPGARRSERAHRAIVGATQALLEEVGYRPLTIEGVAARAGVGKQTIYRWWPSKAALVLEAFLARLLEAIPPPPDTGSTRDDVRDLLVRLVRGLAETSIGRTVMGLVADAQHDPVLAEMFVSAFVERRRDVLREILERGRDRGELRADLDVELVIDSLYGPIFYRLFLGHAELDAGFATRLADAVIAPLET